MVEGVERNAHCEDGNDIDSYFKLMIMNFLLNKSVILLKLFGGVDSLI